MLVAPGFRIALRASGMTKIVLGGRAFIQHFSFKKAFAINKSTVSNSTGLKPAYTALVSCREAAVHNGRQFKGCGLSVMRKKLARAGAAVSRRENETRKLQADRLWFACTSIGNGN